MTDQRSYEVIETEAGLIKAWTRGVPVEERALQQLGRCASLPFIYKHLAVMPDVHFGHGATVGSVIATRGAVVPAAVGVDIGCVDAMTEYLSPTGWVPISEYAGGDVMEYHPEDGTGHFVSPSAYIVRPQREFIHLHTKYGIDQALTSDHRVLCWRIEGRDRHQAQCVVSAEEFAADHDRLVLGNKAVFETSFTPMLGTSLPLTDAEIRVQVMHFADGYIDHQTAEVGVRKPRKIARAHELLTQAGIEYSSSEKTDRTNFRFKPPILEKSFRPFWAASLRQLHIIADEVQRWDGNEKDRAFFTRLKESADFIHYAFAATGRRSVLRQDTHYRDGEIDYRVFAQPNTRVAMAGSPKASIQKIVSSNGKAYCFTVQSGFIVLRRNGQIFMTGNCGMSAVKTSLRAEQLPDNLFAVRSAIEAAVPHGRTDNGGQNDVGAWGELPGAVGKAWSHGETGTARVWMNPDGTGGATDAGSLQGRFRGLIGKHPKLEQCNSVRHLGTLGGGNHFIEVCLDEQGAVWVMLHSGSRGVGGRIGGYFIELAKREMERWFIHLPDKDLAYLPEGSQYFDDYIEAVEWAQDFALANRRLMMRATLDAISKTLGTPWMTVDGPEAVNCHHNFVARENHFGANVLVTRKGAVRAREGDMGIIPGSMGAKSFIVRGKGNRDSFQSCSHGAGRVMSRGAAKKAISLEDHAKATAGVECRKDEDVLDESPAAYKSIDAVMAAQADLVDIVATLKQVVCIKG